MKKYIPYLFFCLCVISIAFIKNDRISIDYQYKRQGNIYNAYTVFSINDTKKPTYEFELISNSSLEKLNSILVKQDEKSYKISFDIVNRPLVSDDKTLKGFTAKVDLDKLLANTSACNATVIFTFSNGNTIQLPIQLCKIKESLKN